MRLRVVEIARRGMFAAGKIARRGTFAGRRNPPPRRVCGSAKTAAAMR
jgi:hypothetical protein